MGLGYLVGDSFSRIGGLIEGVLRIVLIRKFDGGRTLCLGVRVVVLYLI